MPRPLTVAVDGSLQCTLIRFSPESPCGCSPAEGLRIPDPRLLETSQEIFRTSGGCGTATTPPCESLCACEVDRYGADRTSCLTDPAFAPSTFGYCYVDPAQGLGDESIVAKCPVNQKRAIRFGRAEQSETNVVLACINRADGAPNAPGLGRLGSACIPSDEYDAGFPGYQPSEVSIDVDSGDCATGVCLVNHFRGRTTCPYGQTDGSDSGPGRQCYTPEPTHERVTPQVDPWIASATAAPNGRKPDQAVYCSCRCDGPNPSETYCECPTGFECAPLFHDIGQGMGAITGSYCIKAGTGVPDAAQLQTGQPCAWPACSP